MSVSTAAKEATLPLTHHNTRSTFFLNLTFSMSILISKQASPRSPSHLKLPSSSQLVRSAHSIVSPVGTWSKKLGEYVKGDKRDSSLTQESLQEFNKRNALIEARYNSSSPYYKGLTDFSLDINREKPSGFNPVRDRNAVKFISPYYKGLTDFSLVINKEKFSESSPGRESQSASSISSGSKSSLSVKVHEWSSSWFSLKKHKRGNSSSSFSSNKSSHDGCAEKTTENAAAATKVKAKRERKNSESGREIVTLLGMKSEDTTMASQKPLRERDSEPLPMRPLSPLNEPIPESLPYPLPYITQPTAQSFPSPLPTPLSESQAAPTSPMVLQSPAQQPPSTGGVTYENQEINTNGYEREFVWAEKYRPLCLQDFLCNRKAALELQAVARNFHEEGDDCGHFIFEGNPGVGRRTMIWALLREAFGPDKVQARQERKEFRLKGEAVESIHVNLMVSPQHTEVNLSELKGYAKHVILELINEKNQKLSDKVLHSNPENCRAIILYEADKLSTDALSYVKWMLEKFKGCNKVLFCCSDASKLESIKPLCRFIQLLEPTNEEILKVLASIAHQEGIELPQQLANKITENSRNNLRQAIRSFEAIWNFKYSRENHCKASLKGAQLIRTGWEDTIAKIARNAVKEQSPKQLYNIRQELKILIEHNVAPGFILQALKDELKIILPQHLLLQFDKLYNDCKNHVTRKYLASTHQLEESGKRLSDPRKNVHEFMSIEEFMARFMSWYKAWV
ncbi:uncharacterized protein LOC131015887 isoform X2 [Salvia miltiorrhiza]|uniref:uncharacterized protein LOC131015887 isoform X2 n=1 Tax=Salvia miltiorrhiza TaxID=226208 RepID=UPI0025AD8F78|nr:uncharacterized protein LOC131015887 isoform X2 [Salvia miltiorrhiza]